ncbi:hypothetical protein BP6252_04759 [Coleophoma cylindrospora]|uniref:Rab proteins geranylgeranyltransferase n=1 Tax=Coleophoma cylindrospora TaxID=1849047 RepID=A0A3D8S1Y6_9HELO|nr:hypothetical protein BP6252_04759 [Coleophoma cylindrospora]
MEPLSETHWDVVISGTGLQQSLLALALSRTDKKILHVDQNDYYGDAEAAFSLQEVDQWVEKINSATLRSFQNASLWKSETEAEKLSFSRAYTLTLSPQIIYTRSKLLSQLVSSKVYRQLEFQAVGNWWIYQRAGEDVTLAQGSLQRLPNGREDIFTDDNIDLRSKRGLVKFLKFVVDYENQAETWEPHAKDSLHSFLSSKFKLPPSLQTIISALTLSLDTPENTTVAYSLPRIARHLTSIGVFGPGFGAVVPKWGGGSELAQVACRSGAVGGAVYVLGTGVKDINLQEGSDEPGVTLTLTNDEVIRARSLVQATYLRDNPSTKSPVVVSKTISVISSPLSALFTTTVEGAPTPAVSVVVVPAETFHVDDILQLHPVYLMVHSSETGECPVGQSVIYASTSQTASSKKLLDLCVSSFIKAVTAENAQLLYNLHYEQKQSTFESYSAGVVHHLQDPSLDLAFDDALLGDVEEAWNVTAKNIGLEDSGTFLQFEERNPMNGDDEDEDEGF